MTRAAQIARNPRDRLTLWPAALVLLLVGLALVLPDVLAGPRSTVKDMASFRPLDLAFVILGYGALFIVCATKTCFASVTERFRSALSWAVALLCVIAALFHFRDIAEASQIGKLLLYRDHFDACAAAAVEYAATGAFGVCSVSERGNLILTVVYDADGEIVHAREQWSHEFKQHLDAAVGPLLTGCDVDGRPIWSKFYLVRSSCG